MSKFIPVYQPSITSLEREFLIEAFDSSWISSKGKFIDRFEKDFSNFTGAKHSCVVSNGTVAIHLALLALGVGEGDEVIVPTFTYIASVNAIRYVGATPVFADSNAKDFQIDIDSVKKAITPKTKAIMIVHLYGHPCDVRPFKKLAESQNLKIIEDAAEAFGTYIGKSHAGTLGDISTFSFFGNKTITTGEGGMVISNDKHLIDRVRLLKGQAVSPTKEYWHEEVGYNYRMTNLQAAIGCAQLERSTEILKKKRAVASYYKNNLDKENIKFLYEGSDLKNSFWMCTIQVQTAEIRNSLRIFLKENNVDTRPGFPLVHTMPMYQDLPSAKQDFSSAQFLSETTMNIPSWPDLTDEQLSFIVEQINSFFLIQE